MQIQACLQKRKEYLNFTVWLSTNKLIFFCLFHRLNYMKCNISEIFLPSRSGKFGDNVPNRVKRNEHFVLRASAWETGADLEMKVGRFRLKLVHKVVMWTYVICQSFRFNEFFLAEFWISAPQGSPEADFQCNFGHFSISLLATYN